MTDRAYDLGWSLLLGPTISLVVILLGLLDRVNNILHATILVDQVSEIMSGDHSSDVVELFGDTLDVDLSVRALSSLVTKLAAVPTVLLLDVGRGRGLLFAWSGETSREVEGRGSKLLDLDSLVDRGSERLVTVAPALDLSEERGRSGVALLSILLQFVLISNSLVVRVFGVRVANVVHVS